MGCVWRSESLANRIKHEEKNVPHDLIDNEILRTQNRHEEKLDHLGPTDDYLNFKDGSGLLLSLAVSKIILL